MIPIQQSIETLLPVLAAFGISALQQDHWPNYVNVLLAVLALALAGVTTAFLGAKLTGHISADVMIVIASTLALQGVDYMQPYFQYLKTNLTIGKPVTPVTPVAPVTPDAVK